MAAGILGMNRAKTFVDVLMAGVFGGCVAPLISTLLVLLFWTVPAPVSHRWDQLLVGAFWILPLVFVPASLFGFTCGVAGRLYLIMRSSHITNTVHLISECVAVGVLLSLCFPLFLRWMNWGPVQDWASLRGILFCVGVGCTVSLLYAAVYRRDFLG